MFLDSREVHGNGYIIKPSQASEYIHVEDAFKRFKGNSRALCHDISYFLTALEQVCAMQQRHQLCAQLTCSHTHTMSA